MNETAAEEEPLLKNTATPSHGSTSTPTHDEQPDSSSYNSNNKVPTNIARRLYISHFLSTWNSRVFEFGSTLYLAAIFPHTLLPLSVYALVRGVAAIFLSPAVGQYIDRADRLQCVRVSIGELGCFGYECFEVEIMADSTVLCDWQSCSVSSLQCHALYSTFWLMGLSWVMERNLGCWLF